VLDGPRQAGLSRWSRGLLAAAGVALLLCGVLAVFTSGNELGTGALVTAGVVLLVIGAVGDRVSSFKAGAFEVNLIQAAIAKESQAAEAEAAGQTERAAELRQQADALWAQATGVTTGVARLRSTMASGPERTAAMEQYMAIARRLPGTAEDVPVLAESGNRLAALAIMQANGAIASAPVLLAALQHPDNPFEEYHALLAALSAVQAGSLSDVDRQQMRDLVTSAQQRGRYKRDTDRAVVASRLIESLSEGSARR
jgi:hypothetical protein